ncbi:MAG: hypothetical protein AAFU65_08075, partial [Pseudomonadota bacterium]
MSMHRIARSAASLLAFCLMSPATAQAPPCAPPELVVLNANSNGALAEVIETGVTTVDLRFNPATPQLVGLSSGDIVIVAPSALLPTGYQARVINRSLGNGEIVLTLGESKRDTGDTIGLGTVLSYVVPPETLAATSVCTVSEPGSDVDQDNVLDFGIAEAACRGVSGGDIGFTLELVDGVEVNGLLSAAPFDIDGRIEFDEGALVEASFLNTGRLSFTGELNAEVAADLGNENYTVAQVPVASYFIEVLDIGYIDVNITADVFVGACGNVSAGTRAGMVSTGVANLGVSITPENGPQIVAETADSDLRVSPPQLDTDQAVDVTLFGGAELRMSVVYVSAIPIPLAGAETTMTVRGSVRTQVDPAGDPWWTISGRPEVYVDVIPELLFVNFDAFTFDVINPPAQTFFTSQNEFPFDPPTREVRGGDRESGSALRWSRAYRTEASYNARSVAPAADGGAYFAAASTAEGLLIRTDFEGNRLWQRRFTGGYSVSDVTELPDGTLLVGGIRGPGLWIARLSADADVLWSRTLEPDEGLINSLHFADVSGSGVTLGGTLTQNNNEFSPYAASIQPNGTLNWARSFGQTDINETINGVAGTDDGGLVLTGQTGYTPVGPLLGGNNVYTLRVASDGNLDWSHVWASSTFEQGFGVTQTPDGGYAVVGVTGGTNQDSAPRGLILRYDADDVAAPQEVRWVRSIGGSLDTSDLFFDELNAVTADADGLHVAGKTGLSTDAAAWVARVAERGDKPDLVWSTYHDGVDEERIVSLSDMGAAGDWQLGEIVRLPGHTEGSLVAVVGETAFVGDLLRGSVTGTAARTHFYMCDLD